MREGIDFKIMADVFSQQEVSFRLLCMPLGEGVRVYSLGEIARVIESILNENKLIKSTFDLRSFFTKNNYAKGEKLMGEELNNNAAGNLGTFIVKVKYRQNATFQGTIQWVEENRMLNFRSDFEMLKLINEALNKNVPDDTVSW